MTQPPKVSVAHHDEDDSVLLQLSGTKRFTLVDPGPLHGLTAYPSRLRVRKMHRRAAGVYEYAPMSAQGAGEHDAEGDDATTRHVRRMRSTCSVESFSGMVLVRRSRKGVSRSCAECLARCF